MSFGSYGSSMKYNVWNDGYDVKLAAWTIFGDVVKGLR